MQFARGEEVRRSFAAKNATRDDNTLKSARTSVRYLGIRR
jgi:hypothetical protein